VSIVVIGARYSAPVRMRSSAKAAALVAPAFAGVSRRSSTDDAAPARITARARGTLMENEIG
jgi:hypothetical protein